MLRTRFFDAGGGGGGGAAVIDVEKMDLSTAESTRAAIRQIANAAKESQGDREKLVNVVSQMQEFAKKMDDVEAIARGKGQSLTQGEALSRLQMALDPPDDEGQIDRSYFNLTVLSPEELIGLAHVGSRLSGLDTRVQGWLRREFDSATVQRIHEFQRLNDQLLIVSELMWLNGKGPGTRMAETKWQLMRKLKGWKDFEKIGLEFQKALNETTNNQGLYWVPVVMSSNLVDLVQVQLKVAALFPQITMTSKTFENPVLGGDAVAYLQPEATGDGTGTAIPASQPILNKVFFTAQKLAMRIFASSEIIEDSIIAMLPFITGQIAKVIARGIEDAIINGDTNASMDGATYNPAGGVKRAWNGLRQQVFDSTSNPATVSASNAAITKTQALTLLRKQNVYGAIVNEGAWIVGFLGWANLLGQSEMLTREKYGDNATILTGEVGRYFGRPVILSEFVTDNYNASGIYDGVTTDRGEILHVYRSAYTLAQRRDLRIQGSTERHIELDQTVIVGTWRGDFEPYFPASASTAPVGAIYNVGGP